jgi:hypothetical protein
MTKLSQEFKTIGLNEAITLAPAIAATHPHPRIKSPKYAFTNTVEIIESLDKLGFKPTIAKQSKSKSPNGMEFGTHIVRFGNPELYIKDSNGAIEARPEVILINDHAGNRPVQFEMGIFRLVCENGLVIKSQDFGGFRERHTRFDFDTIKRMIGEKVGSMKTVVEKISRWNGTLMSDKDRFAFAAEAVALRLSSDRQPEQYELYEILTPKRKEDESKSLWHTFNVVQENLIKGGYQMNERQARAITNPMQDIKINQELWTLAEAYAA